MGLADMMVLVWGFAWVNMGQRHWSKKMELLAVRKNLKSW